VAAGLPLLTAILGVAISVGAVTALTGPFELTETAPTLATMLGLAVGIDYALFILSRHRQNIATEWSRAKPRPRRPVPRAARSCSPARPW
jgi:putative drug exporter of the RND superfamily